MKRELLIIFVYGVAIMFALVLTDYLFNKDYLTEHIIGSIIGISIGTFLAVFFIGFIDKLP